MNRLLSYNESKHNPLCLSFFKNLGRSAATATYSLAIFVGSLPYTPNIPVVIEDDYLSSRTIYPL